MIRVFIVDDHALVRTGFRLILSAEPDIEVVGEADSAEQALPMIRKLKPDVVLCDLHLPGLSGLEVTERVVRGDYGSRVIVVSVLEDGPMPRRLLEAGAFGYVGKGCDAAELLRAVRDVARGRKYLSSSIAQGLALAGLQGGQASPFDALTPRELEVALLLNQGLRQEAIARQLNLSAKTVNTHKTRLFEKLGIRDTIALARLVSQYGLVDPSQAVN
jgi:DNA-binding NarL/FixJ family response regulator